MDSGFYAAFAGLKARTQALEVAANNLANINTTGYKAHKEFYQAVVAAGGFGALSPLNRAINNYGVLGGARIDFRPGNFDRTGNELDLALEGDGFFAVQTRAGVRYTRNGNFHLADDGRLLTAVGDPVLGEDGPITLVGGPVAVSADGAVAAGAATAGRLRLVEFADPGLLVPEGATYFAAPAASGRSAVTTSVRQGLLESSNLDPVAGAVGLIALQRHAESLSRALSIFHNEFNRTAAEELPRV